MNLDDPILTATRARPGRQQHHRRHPARRRATAGRRRSASCARTQRGQRHERHGGHLSAHPPQRRHPRRRNTRPDGDRPSCGSALLQYGSSDRPAARPSRSSTRATRSWSSVGAVDPAGSAQRRPQQHRLLLVAGPHQRRADQARRHRARRASRARSTAGLQRHVRRVAHRSGHGRAAARRRHSPPPACPCVASLKHFTLDLGARGPDNAYGAGLVSLPRCRRGVRPAPTPATLRSRSPRPSGSSTPAAVAHGARRGHRAARGSRSSTSTCSAGPCPDHRSQRGGRQPHLDRRAACQGIHPGVPVPCRPRSAPRQHAQRRPAGTVRAELRHRAGRAERGHISLYLPTGGNVVIDVLGYFTSNQPVTTRGRFVPLAHAEAVDGHAPGRTCCRELPRRAPRGARR